MEKIKQTLTKPVELPFRINESLISMILGVVVVLLVGLIAYNYFRSHREVVPTTNTTAQVQDQNQVNPNQQTDSQKDSDKIGQGVSAVALPMTHTVAQGESLWTISEKYYKSGYNYVDIIAVNDLTNPGVLAVGQKLTIPKVSVRQPVTIAGATAPVVTTSRIEGSTYTVAKGDTIWEIAVRAYGDGFQYVRIVKANNLTNPGLIFSGNVLKIPR